MADAYMEKAMTLWWYNDPFLLIRDGLMLLGIYGRVEEPIYMFTKALKHHPTNADIPYHLARIYLEQKNDYEKGVPLLERAVALDSSHAYAHYHLAAAYAHLGKKEAH